MDQWPGWISGLLYAPGWVESGVKEFIQEIQLNEGKQRETEGIKSLKIASHQRRCRDEVVVLESGPASGRDHRRKRVRQLYEQTRQ